MPKASQLIANDNLKLLGSYTWKLVKGTVLLCVLAIIIYEVFASQILEIYLGDAPSELVQITRLIMLGILGFAIYTILDSVINAFYVRPINTINIFISFCFFLILSGASILLSENYLLIIISFILAMTLLGFLSLLGAVSIFKDDFFLKGKIKSILRA